MQQSVHRYILHQGTRMKHCVGQFGLVNSSLFGNVLDTTGTKPKYQLSFMQYGLANADEIHDTHINHFFQSIT